MMAASRHQPSFKLTQHPHMPTGMTDRRRHGTNVRVDLDRSQQNGACLASPYHDTFSKPCPRRALPRDSPVPPPGSSRGRDFLTNLFKHFGYSRIPQDPSSAEHEEAGPCADEGVENPVQHQAQWADTSISEESPIDRWFAVIFLLLLLSVLFNFFLLFNGPPNGIIRHLKSKDNPLPHHGFQFQERGKNYTCYEMTNTVFESDFQYSNTFRTYDHLWEEMQGKSHGMVYSSLNRGDGKVRKAGLAMFHQLDCLSKLRSVIQALHHGARQHEDEVGVHADWPHCLDYLRQTILCNADDSIEISELKNGNWVDKGFGSVKECRDQKWLYDVTTCGERGCEGKPFYHSEEEMKRLHREEAQDVERWSKGQKHSS